MNNDRIWSNILNIIVNQVNSATYNTWFKDLILFNYENNTAILKVKYPAQKYHLINNYSELLEDAFLEALNTPTKVEIFDDDDIELYLKKQEEINASKINENKDSLTFNFDNEKNSNSTDDVTYKYYRNFNKKYTFENFVVGPSNRFAYSSAKAVAENPGKLYNLLFIYGKSGLGKTHLLHAIGNYIVQNSNQKVLYMTAEEFVNSYTASFKKSKKSENASDYMSVFKKTYRNVDILMIDDIQFLGNKPGSQQELTNTFNSLWDNEKQIIICSDRSIDDLQLLEDRLKTRFSWGLLADISPPDFDLKVNIIKEKIKNGEYTLDINDEIIEFVASVSGNDVRNIEGMLTRLIFYKAMMNIQTYTLDEAREALSNLKKTLVYTPTSIEKIQEIVADYFQIEVKDLKSKKKNKTVVLARQIAIYLCRKNTDETQARIGAEFGGKDHSTVIYSCNQIQEELKNNEQIVNTINEIEKRLCE